MERLESLRRAEQNRLATAGDRHYFDEPAQLKDYRALLAGLSGFMNDSAAQGHQERVLRALVHKVEVMPEGFRVHYYAGQSHVEKELARMAGSGHSGAGVEILPFRGSNSLQNGGSYRD